MNFLAEQNIDKKFVEIIKPEEISKSIETSDLFITDFSSLVFSFMYLNVPVIFYRLDFFESDENYLKREYLSYAQTKDKYLYNVFYELDNVINKIEYYIENNFINYFTLQEYIDELISSNLIIKVNQNEKDRLIAYIKKG